MPFIDPMKASPVKAGHIFREGEWAAEEKFDGHRLIVETNLEGVSAWSRNQLSRFLPSHIRDELKRFPCMTLDGELTVPNGRSYGVVELGNAHKLCYVVFDVLRVVDHDATRVTYDERRALLEELFSRRGKKGAVTLAWTTLVHSNAEVNALAKEVWARDGEGLILKRRDSLYHPGKRSKDWLKIKQLRSATMRVVSIHEGRSGPASVVLLEDDDGHQTSVKTLNNFWLVQLEDKPNEYIGKRLVIEYQERTPDGGYRHPRWDHWEDA